MTATKSTAKDIKELIKRIRKIAGSLDGNKKIYPDVLISDMLELADEFDTNK